MKQKRFHYSIRTYIMATFLHIHYCHQTQFIQFTKYNWTKLDW